MKKKEEADISYEEAMKRLETIVSELESNELSLDDSIEKFKEGVTLSNHCSSLLNKAEKSVKILIEQSNGEMKEEDFDLE